ncbi:MAG TPA: ABC transporter permease [Acidimicrobiales bacterium]
MAATRRRGRLPRSVLALPSWAWYLLFFVVPLSVIGWYSLGYKPPVTAGKAIGLDRLSFDNYADTVSDTFLDTFTATMRTSITGTVLCLLAGFPIAYHLATRVSPRWRGLLLGLVIVPFWTSFLLRTFAWRIILSPNGVVSTTLQDWHVLGGPIDILDTRSAVQLGVLYNYLPLMIFPLFVALDRLDPALREASKDLGAGRWRTFTQVTLPLAAPGMVAGLLLVFIPLSGEYVTPSILGGAKGLMAGNLVASQFFSAQNWALGSAMAIVLIGLILAAIVVFGAAGLLLREVARRRRRVDVPDGPAAPAAARPVAAGVPA